MQNLPDLRHLRVYFDTTEVSKVHQHQRAQQPAEFIVFDTQSLVFDTEFLVFDTKFIISFSRKAREEQRQEDERAKKRPDFTQISLTFQRKTEEIRGKLHILLVFSIEAQETLNKLPHAHATLVRVCPVGDVPILAKF